MNNGNFSVAEIGIFAATRVALGVGIGLLISRRLSRDASQAAGVALAVTGGLTTIPFVIRAIARKKGCVHEMKVAA
jgi:hypothetical protein